MCLQEASKEEMEELHTECICFYEGASRCGGGFVKALASAVIKADHANSLKLKEAFPEYWEKYIKIGKPIVEADL